MTPGLFQKIVRELAEMGTGYLYLSGGEPLVVEGIEDWISYAVQKIPYVHLVTNGYLLDGAFAKKLAQTRLDRVSVSLDGNEDVHDAFRGKSGAYRKAVQALDNLKRHAPQTLRTVSSLVAPWNASVLDDLEKACIESGVEQRLTAMSIYPAVMGLNNMRQVMTDDPDQALRQIKGYIERYQKRRSPLIDPFVTMIPEYYSLLLKDSEFNHRIFKSPCPVPSYYANLLENGEVFPCPGVGSSLYPGTGTDSHPFSCNTESLKSIFKGKAYQKMRKSLESCQECRKYLPSCYMRPRMHFPFGNLLAYRILPQLSHGLMTLIGRPNR